MITEGEIRLILRGMLSADFDYIKGFYPQRDDLSYIIRKKLDAMTEAGQIKRKGIYYILVRDSV